MPQRRARDAGGASKTTELFVTISICKLRMTRIALDTRRLSQLNLLRTPLLKILCRFFSAPGFAMFPPPEKLNIYV
jgi:hypothetical protein